MTFLPSRPWPIRLVYAAAKAVSLLCRAILVLMVVHIFVDVVFRYAFNIALPGTIAFVSNYYMIAIIFLPLATAEMERRHIEVEVLTQLLPPSVEAFLRLVGWVLAAVVFAMMTRESWTEAMRAFAAGNFILEHGHRIPTWMSFFMLPVGLSVVSLVCLTRAIVTLTWLGEGFFRAVGRAEVVFEEARPAPTHPATGGGDV